MSEEGGPTFRRRTFLGGLVELALISVLPRRARAQDRGWLGLEPEPAGPPGAPGFLPEGAVARLGDLFMQHGGPAGEVRFSPDGRLLVSTGADGVLRFWGVATGEPRGTFDLRGRRVGFVEFAPDGRSVIAAGEGASVAALGSGEEPLEDGSWISAVAVAPGNEWVAIGKPRVEAYTGPGPSKPNEGWVHVQELGRGPPRERSRFLAHGHPVTGMAFSPDERLLATSSRDGWVRVWDTLRFRLRWEAEIGRGSGDTLSWSADGRALAVEAEDRRVRVFARDDGAQVHELGRFPSTVGRVLFHPTDPVLFVATAEDLREVRFGGERPEERVVVERVAGVRGGYGLDVSPDGATLAAAGRDGRIRLFDAARGQELLRGRGLDGAITSLAVGPRGERLVVAGADGRLRVFDLPSGELRLEVEGPEVEVQHLRVLPRGRRALYQTFRTELGVLDLEDGTRTVIHQARARGSWAMDLASDGARLVYGESLGPLLVLEDAAAAIRARLAGEREQALPFRSVTAPGRAPRWTQLLFSPDGRWLVGLVEKKQLLVRDMEAGAWRAPLVHPDDWGSSWGVERTLAFSPDGRRLFSGHTDRRAVTVWDPLRGDLLAEVPSELSPDRLSISPDGRFLVQASAKRPGILLRDPGSLEVRATLPGHEAGVTDLTVTPDARLLVTGGGDGTVILWDLVRHR